jgi:hypothetical protein
LLSTVVVPPVKSSSHANPTRPSRVTQSCLTDRVLLGFLVNTPSSACLSCMRPTPPLRFVSVLSFNARSVLHMTPTHCLTQICSRYQYANDTCMHATFHPGTSRHAMHTQPSLARTWSLLALDCFCLGLSLHVSPRFAPLFAGIYNPMHVDHRCLKRSLLNAFLPSSSLIRVNTSPPSHQLLYVLPGSNTCPLFLLSQHDD